MLIYNFYYENSQKEYILSIDRNSIELEFPNNPRTYFLINRISMEENIFLGRNDIVLEKINDNTYLTYDGLKIEIFSLENRIFLTFLQDNSTLESFGNGKIIFTNNGFLDSVENDKFLVLSPNKLEVDNKTFLTFFTDKNKFRYTRGKLLNDENGTLIVEVILDYLSFYDFVEVNSVISNNNQFNIIADNFNEPLVPIIPNWNINNLDDLFYQ